MGKYSVDVFVNLFNTIEIEANSAEEAHGIAYDMAYGGEIDFSFETMQVEEIVVEDDEE